MKRFAIVAVAVLAGCVAMPEERQALMLRTSSDGALEGAILVAAREVPEHDCSLALHFGADSYGRIFAAAGAGFESNSGGAAVVVSAGAEVPWPAREPLQTRIDMDALLFSGRAVYEFGITGAIDKAEAVKVRVRGGIGFAF